MIRSSHSILFALSGLALSVLAWTACGGDDQQSPHTKLPADAIAVKAPGSYGRAGAVYMLTRDISSPTSAIFLGKDVTLDLNGYTLTYADGDYGHVPNYGFEEGLKDWDTSRAPGARDVNTDEVQIFIGKKILSLPAGQEIVSAYVDLPLAGRSYFAMCGVAVRDMRVSLFVEDARGNPVRCEDSREAGVLTRNSYSTDVPDTFNNDDTGVSCPLLNRTVREGGGFVVAHLHGLPAGKYRIRVRAETDCLLDQIDLRPAMDVGIGVVENTYPWAHNDFHYVGMHCAFYDYTQPGSDSLPVPSVPRVSGEGVITIRNGVIKSGARGVLSWGLQSTAPGVKIVLENVKFSAAGINTNAVDVPQARISNCRFEIETPLIINRHVSEHAVVLRGRQPSEVSGCEFLGGQGCLTVSGRTLVHDNHFVNHQTITNHYSVMAMGDSSQIYNNLFEPVIGSGVEIFRHKYVEVYNNVFHIASSPPTCEYGHSAFSTCATRVADYGAPDGSPRGAIGNRIHDNKVFVTARDFPEYPDYHPMAWAFYHSASGGDTYYYNNEVVIDHRDPASKAEAAAFYVAATGNGGHWYNNRVTSNVKAIWAATLYGGARYADFSNNTFTKVIPPGGDNFALVRLGWNEGKGVDAENIQFHSNTVENGELDFDLQKGAHSYTVYWTLEVRIVSPDGKPLARKPVRILDCRNREAATGLTDDSGLFVAELLEYAAKPGEKTVFSPYRVLAGGQSRTVVLNRNASISLTLK